MIASSLRILIVISSLKCIVVWLTNFVYYFCQFDTILLGCINFNVKFKKL